jgi:hypothetical protein
MKKSDIFLLLIALIGALNLAFGLPGLVAAELQEQAEGNNGLWAVNIYRSQAGVPPVIGDPILTNQCMLHAAYMAENQLASLEEDKLLSMYSSEGSSCAPNALVYLLPANAKFYQANQTVDKWLDSPTHRMWMLYPTLAVVGFGYRVSPAGEEWVTSSAMDVLTGIDFSADGIYPNWPARFPAPGQTGVPAKIFPITTWWPYAGPAPAVNLTATTLTTSEGLAIPFTVNSDPTAYGGHKHITLLPVNPLPYGKIFEVHLEGSYDGETFVYDWKFSTGATVIPAEAATPEGTMIPAVTPTGN